MEGTWIMIIFRLIEEYIKKKKTWDACRHFFQWQDIVFVFKPYSLLFCILIKSCAFLT